MDKNEMDGRWLKEESKIKTSYSVGFLRLALRRNIIELRYVLSFWTLERLEAADNGDPIF